MNAYIEKLIGMIQSGKHDEKQLVTLYRNVMAKSGVEERDRERVIEAIEKDTRLRFPKAAKKLFGAKEQAARAVLQAFLNEIEDEFDPNRNCIGNGVKTGGQMLSGEAHVDVYISFRNGEHEVIAMALVQQTPDSELKARVHRYRAWSGLPTRDAYDEFGIDDLEKAKDLYLRELKIVAGGSPK